MLKPTLLSLSLLTIMSGAAVSPALARIAAAFPDAGATSIKLVLTTPAIFIIVFSLLSARLCARFSKRSILSAGLVIYLIGGVGGGSAASFEMLLVFRAVLGVGVGLIMPLATGLIADFFRGEERARMLGFSTAASNLGGIIATLIAGLLASASWRYSFCVYGLGLPVLALALVFLPEPERKAAETRQRRTLPVAVYAWGFGVFAVMVAFYAVPINLALFLERNGFGGASMAGVASSVVTGTGFVAGLTFGRVRAFGRGLFPLVLPALFAVGYLLLGRASDLPQVLLAVGLVGTGVGWSMPALLNGASRAGGDGTGVQVMAVMSSFIYTGQFLSPVLLGFLSDMYGDGSTRFTFGTISAAAGGVLLVLLARWVTTGRDVSGHDETARRERAGATAPERQTNE